MSVKRNHHIVITRPSGPYAGGDKLARKLQEQGFSTLDLPVLACQAIPLTNETRMLIEEVSKSEKVWLAFLSPSALWVWSTVAHTDPVLAALTERAFLAVQGSGTAAACEECFGRKPDFIPSVFVAEEFAKEYAVVVNRGHRVLVPQSADGRDIFVPLLRQHGIKADSFHLYRLEACEPSAETLLQFNRLHDDQTVVVFMSPSAVRAASNVLGASLSMKKILSVGPITSQAVRQVGLSVWREASEHSEAGIMQTLLVELPGR